MKHCPEFNHLLVLPHLRVQNANAVSSPLTHGFPSLTALIGLMWALERKTRSAGLTLSFKAIGAVCHDYEEQVTSNGFVKSFCLTRNPIGKDGKPLGIAEEGRIHLDLTLVLAVQTHWRSGTDDGHADAITVAELLARMRIAGGTLLPPAQPWRRRYQPYAVDMTGTEDDRKVTFRKARMKLLPGFTLVSREDRLEERLAELRRDTASATPFDAWLSLSRINWRYEPDDHGRKGAWVNDRRGKGWIVPIPVGYGALGDIRAAGSVANARDPHTPFRFVESLYSVGEWLSPHHIEAAEQMLWYPDSQPDKGIYRCRNHYANPPESTSQDYSFTFDLG